VVDEREEERWRTRVAEDRELARQALRVLEGMHPCEYDADGVESAKGYLRSAIEGLNETLGRGSG
jgi:hypothetical protein